MATRCTQQTRDCCEPGRQFKFELIIAARHMLSRAVASVFFEEHRPQNSPKNADTWIIWKSRARLLPPM